ncbi:MAG: prepilin-type N-terminal cleavage/methylation domain-containing protein [Vicinamibacteria bacterium]|nr:prepilin-type N-terminal cleavage/methylation domain-containing protein [Vicinamibacteria bacterium]
MSDSGQRGFSLTELLIAMVATLVVMGPVLALLWDGQNTFTREPEVSERQQNIRVSMDLIQSDLLCAGGRMGALVQVFTDGLDGAGWNGTDVIQFLSTQGDCPDVKVHQVGGSAVNVESNFLLPDCYTRSNYVLLIYDTGSAYWAWVQNLPAGAKFDFALGRQPDPPYSAFAPGTNLNLYGGDPVRVVSLNFIRYQIAPDPTDQNVPCLWKSTTAGLDSGFVFSSPPGPAWELVARGIEDMQVQYINGVGWTVGGPNSPASWTDTPGLICGGAPCVPGNEAHLNSAVRQVRVTLRARAVSVDAIRAVGGKGVQGMTRDEVLVSSTTPREVLLVLSSITLPGLNEPLWR